MTAVLAASTHVEGPQCNAWMKYQRDTARELSRLTRPNGILVLLVSVSDFVRLAFHDVNLLACISPN